jgi:hypothetical protein
MKIELTKHNMTRWCQESELELLKSAGWTQKTAQPKVIKELSDAPIVLKQPVKSKGTEKTLDNANQQGDE